VFDSFALGSGVPRVHFSFCPNYFSLTDSLGPVDFIYIGRKISLSSTHNLFLTTGVLKLGGTTGGIETVTVLVALLGGILSTT
jgi:hypothetical protein